MPTDIGNDVYSQTTWMLENWIDLLTNIESWKHGNASMIGCRWPLGCFVRRSRRYCCVCFSRIFMWLEFLLAFAHSRFSSSRWALTSTSWLLSVTATGIGLTLNILADWQSADGGTVLLRFKLKRWCCTRWDKFLANSDCHQTTKALMPVGCSLL